MESRMRENCTYGSMRGSRRKTAKSVLRVVEDRAGVPDNKGRPALHSPSPLAGQSSRPGERRGGRWNAPSSRHTRSRACPIRSRDRDGTGAIPQGQEEAASPGRARLVCAARIQRRLRQKRQSTAGIPKGVAPSPMCSNSRSDVAALDSRCAAKSSASLHRRREVPSSWRTCSARNI